MLAIECPYAPVTGVASRSPTATPAGNRASNLANTSAANLKSGYDANTALNSTDVALTQDAATRRRQAIQDKIDLMFKDQAAYEGWKAGGH